MKNRLLTQIAAIGIVLAFLLLVSGSALGAPLTGVQGSRIQANFMSQDPDPADAGKDVDLRWQVVNTLTGTTDILRFHLDAGYPFRSEERRVGKECRL